MPLPRIVAHLTRCRAVDLLRRKKSGEERDAEFAREVLDANRDWMAPDRSMEERELDAIREEVLAKLPPGCRRAFELVREEGLSYTEAARVLGVSRAGVSAFVVKAQRRLRRQLNRRGVGGGCGARYSAPPRVALYPARVAEPASRRDVSSEESSAAIVG
ncbi:MAG: sigma-70 family RNA polymerase sigma factor [Gemmatimonadaceae bacterium]